jgi:endo-1,4-beta-D-glucanase Y
MTLLGSRSCGILLAAGAQVALMAFVFVSWYSAPSGSNAGASGAALNAARRFLATYVDPSGRVVRRDQGGDTVSEGQSYALLLAQVAGDHGAFRRVWRWTAAHLQRPDGLLASHATATRVIDGQPASDADLITAWALARTRGNGAAEYQRQARRIALAVLAHETVWSRGRPVLAAGPWATGTPASLNPSYWAVPAFAYLDRATGEQQWGALAAGSVTDARALSGRRYALPPDWARLDGTRMSPTPSPDGEPRSVQYGPDAQRLVVWLASSCDPAAQRLAAAWWPKLSSSASAQALALETDGSVMARGPSPLALVASAAAAQAAGQASARDRLLEQAAAVERQYPTYYGAAWVALGRALLQGSALTGCNGGMA